ncbi:MAG: hypothetical protein ACXADW_11465 [Candidatus Hodarchaeales archaeon]
MSELLTSVESIREAIDKILWGKSFVDVINGYGVENTFILRSLSIKESNLSKYIYKKEYKKSLIEGLLTKEELSMILAQDNIWGVPQEQELEAIDEGIKLLQIKVKDSQFFTVRKKKFEKQLKDLRKRQSNLLQTQNNLFNITAETRAEEVQRRYIVLLSTEDDNEQPYWDSEEEFMNCNDCVLLYNLAIAYYQYNWFSEKELRKIARHPEWRYRWMASKSGDGLFGKPISEWSEMQEGVVYWSQYYDSVYDAYEKPSDVIIDNDEALDAWMREQNKKHKSGTPSKDKNMFGHKKSATKQDHQEQFIMVAQDDKEAVEKVQEMNSEQTRERLRREREIFKKKGGRVKEWDLRKGKHAR